MSTYKRFVKHEEVVRRITLLMEEDDVGIGRAELESALAEGYNEVELQTVLREFEDVLSVIPGRRDIKVIRIDVGDSKSITQVPYWLPENIKDRVKDEIRC